MEPAAGVPDWSTLPDDLLGIIAMHALKSSADDFMAFRGVCNSWRSVATNDKRVANYSKSWPSLPYLMLKSENGKHERQLYSLSKRKICRTFSLPEISGNRCIEARFGWLLLLTVGNSLETRLFNPFSRAQIELPNFETLARSPSSFLAPPGCILRAVLSKNPAEHSQFVLVVLDHSGLVFWRNGDRIWTRINFPVKGVNYYPASSVMVKDVNYSDRDQRFYAIGDNGNVWGWDDSSCTDLELMFCVFRRDITLYFKSVQAYVMESSSPRIGELLLVTRNFSIPGIVKKFTDSETTNFQVFKFDVETVGKTQVEEIKRLEKEAIFVGTNAAICVPTFGAIEPNCVYFSNGCACFSEEEEGERKKSENDGGNYFHPRNDMGVYHLQDESIERFDEAIQELGCLCSPLWIAPSHIA